MLYCGLPSAEVKIKATRNSVNGFVPSSVQSPGTARCIVRSAAATVDVEIAVLEQIGLHGVGMKPGQQQQCCLHLDMCVVRTLCLKALRTNQTFAE